MSEFEFYFTLDVDDEHYIHFCKHTFDVVASDSTGEQTKRLISDGEHDQFNDFCSDTEFDYGVHDVSFNPSTQFYGFTSYEVDLESIDELVGKWKHFFESLGLTVSNHIITTGFEDENSGSH